MTDVSVILIIKPLVGSFHRIAYEVQKYMILSLMLNFDSFRRVKNRRVAIDKIYFFIIG